MLKRILDKQLRNGEDVHIIVREYSITKIWIIVSLAIMYFGLFFFMFWLLNHGVWGALAFGLGLITVAVLAIRSIVLWYLDCFIVTGERIIDVHQEGMFSKTVKELPWPTVQDVIYKQRGMMATLFNYGTVVITTQNATDAIELDNVYNPKEIRDIIAYHATEKTNH